MPISICIICYNEEKNISRCLESVKWANEIIVVDSMSQDTTLEIAARFTDKIFTRGWTGYADQKNFALSKATCDWVFSIDADEEISANLKQEIMQEISKENPKDGYFIPRLSFYQGKWIRHSGFYPDMQLRLFKRTKAQWASKRVHEHVIVKGEIGTLKNNLLHYPYHGTISGQLQTVDEFSKLLAENMYEKGRHFHLILIFIRPPLKFLEIYLFRLGFLDGLPGLIIATTTAYALFVRYVKLREFWNLAKNDFAG